MVYDPLRHLNFRLSGNALAIVARWRDVEAKELGQIVSAETGQSVDETDVAAVGRYLATNHLLDDPGGNAENLVSAKRVTGKKALHTTLIHGYLFFRIPLIQPQNVLARIAPFFDFAFRREFWVATILVALAGVYLASREWDTFIATAKEQLSPEGLVAIAIVLLLLKAVHELGHAIVATRYGCNVATMGVAFLVMAPPFYTDTTDSWRLRNLHHRMRIAGAGVMAELTVAAVALLLWSFIPDGTIRNFAFTVAVTAPITTLAINLNPCMRFDGYFMLMDFWRIENLQARSFALARWKMREVLFGLNDEAPETLPAGIVRKLVAFAWLVWIYRFFLFLGIALLIYSMFAKIAGIVLFAIEIYFFIAAPIIREAQIWWSRKSDIFASRRSRVTLSAFAGLLLLFFVPWSGSSHLPAVMLAAKEEPVHVTSPARIVRVASLETGRRVARGEVLAELESPDIVNQMEQARHREALLRLRLARMSADARDREMNAVLQSDLAATVEKIAGLQRLKDDLVLRAAFDGVVVDCEPDLHPGRWIRPAQRLARLVNPDSYVVRALADEYAVQRIVSRARAKFISDQANLPAVPVTLADIDRVSERVLMLPSLAVANGGWIPAVQARNGDFEPLRPVFAATLSPERGDASGTSSAALAEKAALQAQLRQVRRGIAVVESRPESFAYLVWRQFVRVIIRESGF
ncbi:MAG: HlyD family efflux transporter periplasmic adaptor subunit [Thermomicrobiales bacterium]